MTLSKSGFHPENPHRFRYDFAILIKASPTLAKYVAKNEYGDDSIAFSDPDAVKALNQAILKTTYHLNYWDIPAGHLCPPIPGRADYLFYLRDLVKGKHVRGLDIGVGANCIYPLIGHKSFNWSFVGTDVNPDSLKAAQKILDENKLAASIGLRLQPSKDHIFKGIWEKDETFDFTMCNPPFHASEEEALQGTTRKWKNLKIKPHHAKLNFGGKANELWYPGGEKAFILKMINESVSFKTQCPCFTTLVSKEETLPALKKSLTSLQAKNIQVIPMGQGQKKSRLLVWSWL